MLLLYLASLAAGAVLVGVSLFAHGGDGDADGHDGDADDGDADDGDADHGDESHAGASGAESGLSLTDVLPVASLRFWTFFLAFGGLAGALLTGLGSTSAVVTAVIAAVVGWASGFFVTALLRKLRKEQVSSTLRPDQCVGATGTVLLPVARGAIGRVRVTLEDRVVDFDADTDDEAALGIAEPVIVYEVRADGIAVVTREPGTNESEGTREH